MKALSRSVLLALAIVSIGSTADAQGPEDVGSGVISAPTGSLIEIPAPTVGMVDFNFDLLPPGLITLEEIQDGIMMGHVLADGDIEGRPGNGTYNFQTEGGRALGRVPDASLGDDDAFLVDPPSGDFGEADEIVVVFSSTATEFGFQIGDWAGPFDVECFNGATSVGRVTVDTAGGALQHWVQSAAEFDTCLMTALPANPAANWVIPSFQIPDSVVPVELLIIKID